MGQLVLLSELLRKDCAKHSPDNGKNMGWAWEQGTDGNKVPGMFTGTLPAVYDRGRHDI